MVAMLASFLALNALAIDIMLPSLGLIATDLLLTDPNDQQLVIIAYVLGFGAPQMVFGPIADRFGRRPVLFVSLFGYIVAGSACAYAPEFSTLLALRFTQGVFAAGCRVVAIAVVRDRYAGAPMARTMSLILTVFMVVPILAPALGQVITAAAGWRACFFFLSIAGAVLFVWSFLRLEESLPMEKRRALGVRNALEAYRGVFRQRETLGYMLGGGVFFGALFAFLSSAEQIFREVFGLGDTFAYWFAGVAITLSLVNFANSRLVMRFGMRRLSHAALFIFCTVVSLLLVVTQFTASFAVFYPLFALMFGFFGLIGANFNAIAMQAQGAAAGSASAAYGFATTTLSALIGGFIGRQYDGTTTPLLLGYLAIGVVTLAIVTVTERGKLFREDHASV
ncbi:MAG: DHA1 family bicyclomycin/chloramphenicol resistance-like MFS transporter [Polyangiales bacterium]|jgi:DHA1 family bicyclomycin/chloramphenicol resistance-like MFS transporter